MGSSRSWLFLSTDDFLHTSLDGIATKFGGDCYSPPCYTQTVTLAIYQGLPGNLSLLGSGNIIPVANEFVTASISPVELLAGGTYFVAFQNINGIFVNATYSGRVRTTLYFDETGNGSFDRGPDGVVIPEFGFVAEFSGTVSAVPLGPLPVAWSLLLLAIGSFGFAVTRRNQSQADTN